MPGTAAGTQRLSTVRVFSATSETEARCALFFPDTIMFGLSTMPSSWT